MSLNDGYFADFTKNLNQFSMQKLCDIIVVDRYLGSLNQEAIMCMQELAARRENGDVFDYESFIESQLKKLPEFKVNLTQKMHVGYSLSALKGIK
jgi:hypothetical protein